MHLQAVVRAFARFPYENLTKIIKADSTEGEALLRTPAEVLHEHIATGAGGTCFSLTATLLHLLRALGWRAEPILADRSYGADTHCALLLLVDGDSYLLDPGFLILSPLRLAGAEVRVRTAFNEVLLRPSKTTPGSTPECRWDLYTRQDGREVRRLTFKMEPVDDGDFLRAWRASFGWDMMRYPLLTRVGDAQQKYLQGTRFQVRTHDGVVRDRWSESELIALVEREFGVHKEVATRALSILKRRGEAHG